MSQNSNDRIWATRDRTKVPPQRRLARAMRRAPTLAETRLWNALRRRLELRKSHFRRQVHIGPYIVDFICHASRLIIEVDGGQHAGSKSDQKRDRFLQQEGYRVLRFWNNDVIGNIDGVLFEIQSALTTTPTPDPSPQGGGEIKSAVTGDNSFGRAPMETTR